MSSKLTEAQRRAVAKYNAKSYDRIELKVRKGEKDKIKLYAQEHGESLNAFINRAIYEAMKHDNEIADKSKLLKMNNQ